MGDCTIDSVLFVGSAEFIAWFHKGVGWSIHRTGIVFGGFGGRGRWRITMWIEWPPGIFPFSGIKLITMLECLIPKDSLTKKGYSIVFIQEKWNVKGIKMKYERKNVTISTRCSIHQEIPSLTLTNLAKRMFVDLNLCGINIHYKIYQEIPLEHKENSHLSADPLIISPRELECPFVQPVWTFFTKRKTEAPSSPPQNSSNLQRESGVEFHESINSR